MRASGWLAAVSLTVAAAATAAAEPQPKPVDIKPFRDKLIVLIDADGGTYVVTPAGADAGADEMRIFYGTGKTLYAQLHVRRSRNGDAWALTSFAPRIPQMRPAYLRRTAAGAYERSCAMPDDTVALSELTGSKAAAVLDTSKFLTTPMTRRAKFLGRDDTGVYYYVDLLRDEYGGNGYRVFVGKKGAMKQVQLTDVAVDSAGEVFASKNGDLRLIHDLRPHGLGTAAWVRGGKRVELTPLDLSVNSPLIYRDLRIYKSLGTFCDHL